MKVGSHLDIQFILFKTSVNLIQNMASRWLDNCVLSVIVMVWFVLIIINSCIEVGRGEGLLHG